MAPTSVPRHVSVAFLLLLSLAVGVVVGPTALHAQHKGHDAATDDRASTRRLGQIAFPNRGSATAQTPFLEGIALLHNFHYSEAAARFRQAEAADPSFALPYWAEALSYSAVLWGYESLDSSHAALRRLGPSSTARLARAHTADERAFGTVVEAFYGDGPLPERAHAAADAARRWALASPDGEEPIAFAALAVMMEGNITDGPTRDSLLDESAGYAQRLFERNPRHPGAAHYLIHAWDRRGKAERGLVAARAYDLIAPDAEHALHMPSHIYFQLGMWPEMARSNERAWAASRAPGAGRPRSGDAHDLEWLQYAYLQRGLWREARALVDTARRLWADAHDFAAEPDESHAATFLAFRYGVDTGDWSLWPSTVDSAGARAEAVTGPNGAAASVRARAMGLTRAYQEAVGALFAHGDTTAARTTATRFAAEATELSRASPTPTSIAAITMRGLAAQLDGLVAERRGDRTGALGAFRLATAMLPGNGSSVPTTLLSRELLASAQLVAGDARASAIVFDSALTASPNRSSLLLGAARAHAAAGDTSASTQAYTVLHANWAQADINLSALAEVRRGSSAASPVGKGMASHVPPATTSWMRAQWVTAAVLPLPLELRTGAGVVRRGPLGEEDLRPSSNGYTCLAAVPGDTLFDMRCYQAPYIAAIRHMIALQRSGAAGRSVGARMDADVRAGRVALPAAPSAGYRMLGPLESYDAVRGLAGPAIHAWQSLHVPFRTGAELGLPSEPRGTHPFLMSGGTWWAHVMIVHDSATATP